MPLSSELRISVQAARAVYGNDLEACGFVGSEEGIAVLAALIRRYTLWSEH